MAMFSKHQKKSVTLVLIILSIGLLLRLLFIFIIHPPEKYLYSDMQGYYERAIKWSAGGDEDIYDSFYPPATHVIYSVFFKTSDPFLWIKLFNVIISLSTCILIYLTTKILFSERAGIISLAISSFNYIFIDFAGYLLSETLFAFMLALMFYFFLQSVTTSMQRQRWVYSFLAGLTIIIAGAIKSSVLLFIPFFGIWWLFNIKKYKIASNLAFYMAGFIPLFILLALRFYSLTGEFGVVSSNGGFNFFQGRSHIKDAHFEDRSRNTYYMFASPVAVYKNYTYNDSFQTGPYDSDFFYKKGIEEVRKDIPLTLKYSLGNLYNFFLLPDIWPSFAVDKPFPALIKAAGILFIILVLLPAIFILFFHLRFLSGGNRILILFPIITIIITTIIFYGDPRFRVPYDVFFITLAGYFYTTIERFLLTRTHSSVSDKTF
jgi:4-amino-4-deoxy-L-arabinose transferase-like glycosyltransferase